MVHLGVFGRIISTHTPLARRDLTRPWALNRRRRFLLTRLSRGVTQLSVGTRVSVPISTHTPLARRDLELRHQRNAFLISTHTPLARRDVTVSLEMYFSNISTHTPLARRDTTRHNLSVHQRISTHTPLARRDELKALPNWVCWNFYSHASREA